MKKNKKLKGMTLVECIVALAVLTVFTTGMVTATIGLSKIKVDTNEVIKKNSYQAQIADNRNSSLCSESDSTITITFGSSSKVFTAQKHTAKSKIEKEDGTEEYQSIDGRNFQYYNQIDVKP